MKERPILFSRADGARECERLGGFYVGKTVYKCEKERE